MLSPSRNTIVPVPFITLQNVVVRYFSIKKWYCRCLCQECALSLLNQLSRGKRKMAMPDYGGGSILSGELDYGENSILSGDLSLAPTLLKRLRV